MSTTDRFFTKVLGTEIHWAEQGRGRPLVLLHGLHDSHRTWRHVAPGLARGRRVLMPDLPGHGLSGRPDAAYDLPWYASMLGAWFEQLGIDDMDIVGHSFGGGLAQFLLIEHRARVRRLGLLAAGGLGPEVSWGLRLIALPRLVEWIGQPFLGVTTRAVMSSVGGVFAPEDIAWLSWVNSMPGSAMAIGRTVCDVIDWRGQRRQFVEHLARLEQLPPIAVFWGDRDPVIPVMHTTAFASLLDGVTVTCFRGCGHFPHFERPGEIVESISHFLDDPFARPARVRRSGERRLLDPAEPALAM